METKRLNSLIDCPFCNIDEKRIISDYDQFIVILFRKIHTLIIPGDVLKVILV